MVKEVTLNRIRSNTQMVNLIKPPEGPDICIKQVSGPSVGKDKTLFHSVITQASPLKNSRLACVIRIGFGRLVAKDLSLVEQAATILMEVQKRQVCFAVRRNRPIPWKTEGLLLRKHPRVCPDGPQHGRILHLYTGNRRSISSRPHC